VKSKFRLSYDPRESLHDPVIQRIPPIWMEALEGLYGRQGHRVHRAVVLTNAVERDLLVFVVFPLHRLNEPVIQRIPPIWMEALERLH